MKKWQMWLLAILTVFIIMLAIGGAYYLYNMNVTEEPVSNEIITPVEGEEELDEVDRELQELEDLDLSELEEAEKELEDLDLSEF